MTQIETQKSKQFSSRFRYALLISAAAIALVFTFFYKFRTAPENVFYGRENPEIFCSHSVKKKFSATILSQVQIPEHLILNPALRDTVVIDQLKFLLAATKLKNINFQTEFDFSRFKLAYGPADEKDKLYKFNFNKSATNNIFTPQDYSFLKSTKKKRLFKVSTEIEGISCGLLPESTEIKLPIYPYFINTANAYNEYKDCFRHELTADIDRRMWWFFWEPSDKKICPLEEISQTATILFKDLPSAEKIQNIEAKNTESKNVTLFISPDSDLITFQKLKGLNLQILLETAVNIDNPNQLKVFLAERFSELPSIKTLFVLFWQTARLYKTKSFTMNVSADHITIILPTDSSEIVRIVFTDSTKIDDTRINTTFRGFIENSSLVIYTGHSLVGQSYVDRLIHLAESSSAGPNVFGVFSCHSYAYYKQNKASKVSYYYSAGEIVDYEGDLPFGLLVDYKISHANVFKKHVTGPSYKNLIFYQAATD